MASFDWEVPRPRDRKIDEAKSALMDRYFGDETKEEVYYGRQLEIWLEKEFFHWITKKALNELAQEGKVGFDRVSRGNVVAHFYRPRRYRYPRRRIAQIADLIGRFSHPLYESAWPTRRVAC